MYLVNIRLRAPDSTGPSGSAPRPSPSCLRSLLADHARPDDGIEHVYCQSSPAGLEATLFVLRSSLSEAEQAAARCCRRCLDRGGGLSGWILESCAADLVAPLAFRVLFEEDDPDSNVHLQDADSRDDLPEA